MIKKEMVSGDSSMTQYRTYLKVFTNILYSCASQSLIAAFSSVSVSDTYATFAYADFRPQNPPKHHPTHSSTDTAVTANTNSSNADRDTFTTTIVSPSPSLAPPFLSRFENLGASGYGCGARASKSELRIC